MPGQFLSPEGDLEDYFVTEYWLIDQYIGDELWTWGFGTSGQHGDNTTTNKSTPITTFAGGTNWKQVSCGSRFVAAIKTDGTLWTWGENGFGQLGINNDLGQPSTPVTTFAGGNNWKQVSAGNSNAAAIKTDGTLWTWGLGASGQLGNATTIGEVSTPVTTFAGGTNWKQVSVSNTRMAAIKTDGTLWTWGFGGQGVLGNNDTTNRSTPVTTSSGGTNWKQVSAGTNHTAAIKTDGTLWTWGSGTFGGLGTELANDRSNPVTTFAGGNNWKQVDTGSNFTAAIKTNGTLWTWGSNAPNGNLGNASTSNSNTPITTFAGGTNWKQVSGKAGSANANSTAAIKTDGTLWVWGSNSNVALGINATGIRSTPVTTFSGGSNWKQVSVGYTQIAAVESGINAEYPLS